MINRLSIFNLYYQWWKNIDKFLFSIIILLFSIGLFFSLVSTSLIASDKLNTKDSLACKPKHLVPLAIEHILFGDWSAQKNQLSPLGTF